MKQAMTRHDAFEAIHAERERQNEMFPNQWSPGETSIEAKYIILAEEMGEVARDIHEGRSPREELVQLAAVAVAMLESEEE